MAGSENDLRTQLQAARVIRSAENPAETGGVCHVVGRLSVYHRIQNIKCFRPKLDSPGFEKWELAEYREVQVPERHSTQPIAAKVAESVQIGYGKGISVQAGVWTDMGNIWVVTNKIGPFILGPADVSSI